MTPKLTQRSSDVYTTELKCLCRGCPSFKGTRETADNFCAMGKSSIITMEKGCICKTCPITIRTGTENLYCCTRGTKTLDMFEGLRRAL
ncbi:MAG: hypothetical protein C4K49_11940 [Candidatus Thorarchaeota archaeon]|nr:MAG: hypothetical protein C4K49_11940 [Candidatus Thorarchaeota archaeon]